MIPPALLKAAGVSESGKNQASAQAPRGGGGQRSVLAATLSQVRVSQAVTVRDVLHVASPIVSSSAGTGTHPLAGYYPHPTSQPFQTAWDAQQALECSEMRHVLYMNKKREISKTPSPRARSHQELAG